MQYPSLSNCLETKECEKPITGEKHDLHKAEEFEPAHRQIEWLPNEGTDKKEVMQSYTGALAVMASSQERSRNAC